MIIDILKKAYEQKKLISIITNDLDDDESLSGYIINIDSTYFTIREVNKFGIFDGSTIYAINDIISATLDNWYLRNLQIVMDNHSIFNQDLRTTVWKKGEELLPYFSYLKENMEITMLFFETEDFEIGIILDFDDEFVSIKNIGQDGYELGITYYRIDNIIGLKYNGLGEQKTKLLYKTFKDIGDKY